MHCAIRRSVTVPSDIESHKIKLSLSEEKFLRIVSDAIFSTQNQEIKDMMTATNSAALKAVTEAVGAVEGAVEAVEGAGQAVDALRVGEDVGVDEQLSNFTTMKLHGGSVSVDGYTKFGYGPSY